MKSEKTILITGCAGLFGAHLSRYMVDKGHKVIGIDNLSGGYKDFVNEDSIIFIKGDLSDGENLKLLFEQYKPDYVYHTAAFAAVGLSPFLRNFCYTNNLVCYANLINCCINNDVEKFIHFSSTDVYGTDQVPYLETFVPKPEDPYGISKFAIEQDLVNANKQFGLKYSIVRPHNVVGIYQNVWDRYRNVLGIWIRKCINNESITVYGDGTQVRAFSDVKYYMEPLEILQNQHDGEIFNIGADNPIQIVEAARLVQKIAKSFGHDRDIVHLEPRNEVHAAFPDHAKAKEMLGFKDETDLEKTITELYEWVLQQPKRKVKFVDYEIDKGLYSYWKK